MIHGINLLFGCDLHNESVEEDLDGRVIACINGFQFFIGTVSILRTGEFFAEMGKTESIMDTLVEDAAESGVALDKKNGSAAVLYGALCCGKTCRTSADNYDVVILHAFTSVSVSLSKNRLEPSES